jgi:uncharacterized protein
VVQTARIVLAGQPVELLAEKALYWPASSTLIVADLHWGKAASFRAMAIPVPPGTTAADLSRLDSALEQTGARRLLVLGDLLHARAAQDARATLELIRAWRRRRAALECVLVRGNHDLRAGDPPADLDFRVTDALTESPFVFRHHPGTSGDGYTLAGHLHPSIRLSGRGDRIRLPCFHFGRRMGVLPAFGSFTGTATPDIEPDDRVFVVGDGEVHEVTGSAGVCPGRLL